MAIADM